MRADPAPFSLERSLGRACASPDEVAAALDADTRLDLRGLPLGAAALILCRTAQAPPRLLVTPDLQTARQLAADLRFFLGLEAETHANDRPVLLYPSSDISPYLEVAPDRRAAMDRLAVLFHLAQELPCRFVVAPAAALVRKVAPASAIRATSVLVRAEDELDRDELLRVLAEGGYLRVPVAEDPGTFAVRGALIDIYPPHAPYPARIELDDYLVLSIKQFDPDDQRTVATVDALHVHPVRETMLGERELARAKSRVRTLCDDADYPSTRTRQLLEDIESGRAFYGIDGLLPAFHEHLHTLLDFLPEDSPVTVFDPPASNRAVRRELDHAQADLASRRSQGAPVYPIEQHYLSSDELATRLTDRRHSLVHLLAIAGTLDEDEEHDGLSLFETVDPETLVDAGGQDQLALAGDLKAHRARRDDPLLALSHRVRAWLDAGLRVLFTARNTTQAERMVGMLKAQDLPLQKAPVGALVPATLHSPPTGAVEIVVGGLADGFLLPGTALCVVTEEEVFGARAQRNASRRRRKKDNTQPFVSDLRALVVGDYVVHIDHGIGKYLGIERKTIGQSQYERMQGTDSTSVEVLVVEYATGDKLYLPVHRLNQIQKLTGKDGSAPKIDKLGGQTFAKTKAKVRKRVQILADELLALYARRAAQHRPALCAPGPEYAQLEATFPFEETADQARAIHEVLGDLERDHPMDRVVCGDVGFGKTEVAIRAAFRSAMAGRQVAVLCPTTVLAQQHYLNVSDRFREYPLEVRTLSRFVDKATQATTLAGLRDGSVDVVIGTHRLLSKDVHFKQLGLLVVDEEQRFGVTHKERIKKLRTAVDVLTLSATPIPRTLQMAIGGLRELSLITTAPVDRRAVRTFVSRWDDHIVSEAVRRELARGGQVFFVYNRIEGLYERGSRLQQLVPEAKIAIAHGQMKEGELERVMTDFVEGRYDVLCSTAIIESGLDIPRANTMLVDRADMFGLSQLYQLRGRVGRSRERAYCYLLTPPPTRMSDDARYRIQALERFTELGSGFHVASLDMEQRGAGDLLGADQSGNVALVGFDLFMHMLEEAVAHLRGQPVVSDIDPELTFDAEFHIPEDYVDDVGLRLSLYKRLASAIDDATVTELGEEMEDRFGPPPPPTRALMRVMALKPALRQLRALGCEATPTRVTLHLREDTPLDPQKILAKVSKPGSPWKITSDMKLTRRFEHPQNQSTTGIDRAEAFLVELRAIHERSD